MTLGDPSASEPRNRAERRSAAKGTRRRKAVAVGTGASVLLGGVQVFTAAPASASTFQVTTGNDVVNGGDGLLSLREAVTAANLSAGADTITFAPSLSVVTVDQGQIDINTAALAINGTGRDQLTITTDSATHNGHTRIFYMGHSGATTISDLTISGGDAGSNGGAAMLTSGVDLTLTGVRLSGNTTTGGGGVLWFRGYDHDLTITDSLVSGNHATGSGGALYVHTGGTVSITDSTVDHNTSLYGGGSAYLRLRDGGQATIGSSTFDDNTAGTNGGAVVIRGDRNYYGTPFSSTATISGVDFTDNQARSGGGLATTGQGVDVTVTGGSMSGNAAGSEGGGAYLLSSGGDVTVSSVAVHDNSALYFGGGVEVVTSAVVSISGTTFDGNTADKGGAGLMLWPRNGSVADVSDSTFVDNVKGTYNGLYGGGGLAVGAGGTGTGSTVTVSSSTFQDNQSGTDGGGVSASGSHADVRVVNSTFTGNTADVDGGAVHTTNQATLTVEQSTIAGNHAAGTAGGVKSESTVSLSGSIVSGNTSAADADLAVSGVGTLSATSSLVGALPSGVTDDGGNLVGVDPQLGPLALNGGTTKNFLPASGSPVRDAGPSPFSGPSVDQRGAARVFGSRVDIGSVEIQSVPTTTTTAPPSFVPPTTSTTAPPAAPPSTPPTTAPPSGDGPPAPPSVPSGGSSPVFVEDGEVKQVPLPRSAPPNQVTAAVALSPTESIAVTADGRIFTTTPGDNHGGIPAGKKLNAPIVGLGIHWTLKPKTAGFESAAEADEWEPSGYWLLAADGGVFSFGTASFHGSTGARKLNAPIVGLTPTATGNGYYLVAADGGVFSFGDARFFGSTGGRKLAKPIVSMVPTSTGKGYFLVAADGGVFTFGDARFVGSGASTGQRFVGAITTDTGLGYWLLTSDGKRLPYGDA